MNEMQDYLEDSLKFVPIFQWANYFWHFIIFDEVRVPPLFFCKPKNILTAKTYHVLPTAGLGASATFINSFDPPPGFYKADAANTQNVTDEEQRLEEAGKEPRPIS